MNYAKDLKEKGLVFKVGGKPFDCPQFYETVVADVEKKAEEWIDKDLWLDLETEFLCDLSSDKEEFGDFLHQNADDFWAEYEVPETAWKFFEAKYSGYDSKPLPQDFAHDLKELILDAFKLHAESIVKMRINTKG